MISCVIVAENAKKMRDCIRTLAFCLDAVLYCKNDLDDKSHSMECLILVVPHKHMMIKEY
jgi:hypothetical protein